MHSTSPKHNKVKAVLSILQSELESAKDEDLTQETLEQLFGFAVIWGFGGAMIDDKSNQNRTKFNDLFRSNFKQIAIPKKARFMITSTK